MRFGIGLDFRNRRGGRRPWTEVYEDTLRLAVYAEQLGFDSSGCGAPLRRPRATCLA